MRGWPTRSYRGCIRPFPRSLSYRATSSSIREITHPPVLAEHDPPVATASLAGYASRMCRNIRTLHNFEPPATEDEVRAAALQYVRKISGSAKPSAANAEAFERAVEAVTAASAQLLDSLVTTAPPKDREVEAAKARARAAQRYAA
jgi:hypothetical protein